MSYEFRNLPNHGYFRRTRNTGDAKYKRLGDDSGMIQISEEGKKKCMNLGMPIAEGDHVRVAYCEKNDSFGLSTDSTIDTYRWRKSGKLRKDGSMPLEISSQHLGVKAGVTLLEANFRIEKPRHGQPYKVCLIPISTVKDSKNPLLL